MQFINANGHVLEDGNTCISADNHSYRYGNGLVETMKVKNGKILLSHFHFDRLFNGLAILQIEPAKLGPSQLEKEVTDLCKNNDCEQLARVRLSVSGGNGGLFDNDGSINYLIECWSLNDEVNKLNVDGLAIDIFPAARKSCDVYSNLKSASHLPYVMAAKFATANKLNDCLLFNNYNRVCDTTIANLFWIKDQTIFTPPLSEGCIAGVMRRYLMEKLQTAGYRMQQQVCEVKELEAADEIFLTNAIRGIRWVKQFGVNHYSNAITKEIHRQFLELAFFR